MDSTLQQHRPLILIAGVLCLLHGVFLSWRHVSENWDTGTTAPVMTLSLSEAPTVTPQEVAKPKPRPVQKVQPTPTPAPAVEPIVPVAASSPLSAQVKLDLKQMYLSELRARIERNKVYPLQASRLGQSGTVEVSFTLTPEGHIIDSRVTRPCAYQRLNEAALAAVAGLKSFRPIPAELELRELAVTVPIRYSLFQ